MKYRMSGILQRVRLGQVRKARKSSIIRPPLLSMFIFRNSEKNRQRRGYPGGVRWWKNWLKGLFKRVRLGQVRKAIKSWKSEAWGPPIHSLTCFGQKFERTVFERTTSSRSANFDFHKNLNYRKYSRNVRRFWTLFCLQKLNLTYMRVIKNLNILINVETDSLMN
jgi:hypothetical protein